jgi:hypothetical protein
LVAQWLKIRTAPRSRLERRYSQWANSIISECQANHSHISFDTGFCPDRLLDVQSEPLRLVLKEDVEPSPRYAALSYCWSSKAESEKQLKTTGESIRQRLCEIPFDDLTPVVRDAIQMTRSLSIPFLWVDALSICQDSLGDWESHAAVMDKIYGSCYITIAAFASKSCLEQFIRTKSPSIYIPFQSTIKLTARGLYGLNFFNTLRRDLLVMGEQEKLIQQSLHCQWEKRGWTYQESFMSTRVLGLSDFSMSFYCQSMSTCFESNTGDRAYAFLLGNLLGNFFSENKEPRTSMTAGGWETIVDDYSVGYRGFA